MKLAVVFTLNFCLKFVLPDASKNNRTVEEDIWKTDECGRPLFKVPQVHTCRAALHFNAYKKRCKSFPSPPRDLRHSFIFHQNSQLLDLVISWDKPEYGESTLWGYDVILSDSHHSMERCHQVSGKEAFYRNFTFKSIGFDRCYFAVVTSLPKRSRGMKNSIESLITSPDICNYFEDIDAAVPFSCAYIENLALVQSCNASGNAIVSWNSPTCAFDEIFAEVHSSCSQHIKDINLEKDASTVLLEDLRIGCNYFVQLHMVLKQDSSWKISAGSNISFDCLALKEPGKKQLASIKLSRKPEKSFFSANQNLILYLSISLLVLVIIVMALIGRQRRRRTFRGFKAAKKHPMLALHDAEQMQLGKDAGEKAISVMLLHGAGCEYLKELVLIFASFLNANGFNVRLDLLETNLMAHMNTASYYESVERESDYVIIICSDVSATGCSQGKAYNFILDIIKHNIMDTQDRSKYIPVYFDKLSTLPDALRGFAKRIPDEMDQILAMLLSIPRYFVSNEASLPVKNDIVVSDQLTSLNICISSVLERVHPSCPISQCKRGIASLSAAEDLACSFPEVLDQV
ncbi:uncharacterized protein LOC135686194 [Rhopilema esculentum]|uniref:uncharacterized protein LOC135686194 n=1 Tax=Rhopilema esculentum TaxID=499914 RepID=UPI0031DE278B